MNRAMQILKRGVRHLSMTLQLTLCCGESRNIMKYPEPSCQFHILLYPDISRFCPSVYCSISLLVVEASKRIGLAGTPQFSGFATVLMDRSKGWTVYGEGHKILDVMLA
jgi:hypothetical protein